MHPTELTRAHRIAFAAVLLVLASPSAGCRSKATPARAPASIPAQRVGAPRFADPWTGAALSTTTLTLDFGRVRLRTEARRDAHLRNDGMATFTVTALRASDGFPDAFTYPAAPLHVGPDDDLTLPVTFRPIAEGSINGSLELVIENGDHNSPLTIAMAGTGYRSDSPEFELGPDYLDFGDVELTTSWTAHVTLANLGADLPDTTADNLRFEVLGPDGTQVIAPPRITGPDAAEFSLDWPPSDYSSEGLAEGETTDLHLRFAPTSEGPKSASLVIETNDPRRPVVEVRLSGHAFPFSPCEFAVVPPSINFGALQAGRYLTRSLTIRNMTSHRSHSCELVSLDLSTDTRHAGTFQLVNGPVVQPTSMAPGAALAIPIRFAPESDGIFSGEVAFEVAGPNPTTHAVPLSGSSSFCLAFTPPKPDFGDVGVHCRSTEHPITLYNTCTASAVVSGIAIHPQCSSGEFTISRMAALPAIIPGGGQFTFGVTYQPADLGPDTCSVDVSVRSGYSAISIPLAGVGASRPQTDVFDNDDQPKVDLILIIDNSSSMADKQASLTRNLASFIQYALQQHMDYHFAVTTTDATSTGEAGRFVPLSGTNPRFITPTTPDKQQAFTQNVAVGTSGSEAESLIRPAYLALTNPLINGHNAGFYRDEAKLVIVVISDAADQDPSSTPVSFYENFLLNLKGMKRGGIHTIVSAILPTQSQAPAGCTYDTATAGQDLRLRQLVQRTGGFMGEICDADWMPTLKSLGTRVFGLRTTYFLSNAPDMTVTPDPIVVTVDAVRMDQYDSATGLRRWDYNAASNALEFYPDFVPESGSRITVTYFVACSP